MTKKILCIFAVLSIAAVVYAAYNASNYLMWPTNSTNYPPTSLSGWSSSPPAVGTTIDAPTAYGGGVQRRADESQLTGNYLDNAPENSIIVYSRYTPVNTTGEFVLIHGDDSTSCWVFWTATNTVATILRMKPSIGTSSRALGEVNELRWDYSGDHPYRLYFVGYNISNSMQVGTENVPTSFYYTDINPSTGVQSTPVLIHDFSIEFTSTGTYPTGGYADSYIANDVEGDSSNDSRYWAWMVMDSGTGGTYLPYSIITYDMQTDTILGRLQRDCSGVSSPCTVLNTPAESSPHLSKPNMVEISPSGLRVVIDYGRTYVGNRSADEGTYADGPHACLKDMTDCIRVGADETHSGWAWGPNGEEMFISQNNRNDFIEAVDIESSITAGCSVITGNEYACGIKIAEYASFDNGGWNLGMHFGKVYDSNVKGWAFMNTYDDDVTYWGRNGMYLLEIKAYNADPAPETWRISPSYNINWDYRSEGSGALNFDASEIWTTGNWGQAVGANDNQAYSIGLPSGWKSQIVDGYSEPSAHRSGGAPSGGTGAWR